jgi:hypothetical protein
MNHGPNMDATETIGIGVGGKFTHHPRLALSILLVQKEWVLLLSRLHASP